MALGIRHTDHVAPSIRKKLTPVWPTSGGHLVGIIRSRTQATEVFFFFWYYSDISNILQHNENLL
jgi:hypothetical protein